MVTRKNRLNSLNNLFKKPVFNMNAKDYQNWLRKTLIRSMVSVGVLVCILIIQMIDFGPSNRALSFVESKLEYNASIKSYAAEVGKLSSYITTLGNRALEAVKIEDKAESKFIVPTNGEIVTYFNENIRETSNVSKGIIFSSSDEENVHSVDTGVVIEVGANKSIGNYIIIKHRGELLSVYKYLESNAVELNQRVEKGQIIGTSSEELLLEIWYRNEAIDPIQYMDLSARQL